MTGLRIAGAHLIALALAACAESPAPVTAGSPATPVGATYADSECAACVDAACLAEITSCAGDPECGAYLQCLRDCPLAGGADVDPTCASSCPSAIDSRGAELIADLEACRTAGLGSICSLCGSTLGDSLNGQQCEPSNETTPCFKCEDEHCCESEGECAADSDCDAYDQCIHQCSIAGGEDCLETCFAQNPKGLAKWTPIYACAIKNCNAFAPSCDVNQVSSCTRCLYVDCQSAYLPLLLDPFGYLLDDCIRSSPDKAGDDACYARYPTAKPLDDALADCVAAKCTKDCAQ